MEPISHQINEIEQFDKMRMNRSDPVTSGETAVFKDLIRPHLKNYCPASNLDMNEQVRLRISQGEKIYHFAFGQSPFPVVPCMVQALQENAGEKAYLPVAGIPELRKGIVNFHRQYDGLANISEDQIIVGPGSKELIFLVLTVFQGDVLVVSPSWTTYKPQTQLANLKAFDVVTSKEKDWKITPDVVEKAVLENNLLQRNKLMILCNPCNPTGACYDSEELKALSEVCRKYNIIVLCDEIYGRLKFDGNHQTLLKHYPEGCILSSGMSKWASAGGWRIGYHIYPEALGSLKNAVKSAASHTYSCCPAPIQYAITQGLRKEEEISSYIKHTSRIMAAVGKYSYSELIAIGLKAAEPLAGYYIFPDFEILKEKLKRRGITTCTQMCQALLSEAKVAVMAGGPAFLRPYDELTVRLCFVNFDGAESLLASQQIGLEQPLPDNFVQVHCTPAYEGIQALKAWVVKQLE